MTDERPRGINHVARAMRKSVEKWMKEEGGGVREEVDFACHFVSSTINPKA